MLEKWQSNVLKTARQCIVWLCNLPETSSATPDAWCCGVGGELPRQPDCVASNRSLRIRILGKLRLEPKISILGLKTAVSFLEPFSF